MNHHVITYNMISAVRAGRLKKVRELISTYSLSYSSVWSEGYVLLRDATQNGHTEVARLLLEHGSKVNSKNNKKSDTPLHFAIKCDIEIVKMLLDRGADIDAKNKYDRTPLHVAVVNKKLEIIELLLNRGANVNAKDDYGLTCLHIAVEKGYLQITECLLRHGAYINFPYTRPYLHTEYTPLYIAVQHGHEEIVKLLLSKGANVDAKGEDGKTSLHIAAERGYLQIVECLLSGMSLKCGVDVNFVNASTFKENYTSLHLAIRNGHEKVVKLLLDYVTTIDAQCKDGKTILQFAVENGCLAIIEHILKRYPDVNNENNKNVLNTAVISSGIKYSIVETLLQYGFTINLKANNYELLHAAIVKGYLKIVKELLKYGIDVNNMLYTSISEKGYMPLHVATIHSNEKAVELLINYGADINARDRTGKNPIFYAIENADLKITKLLLTNRANVRDDPEILNIAVKKALKFNEYKEIIEDLLKHGADVNSTDKYGKTALHFTISSEEFLVKTEYPDINYVRGEIAALLLNRGANVNAQSKIGTTTLHSASEKGYVKLVEVLLAHNVDVNSTDFRTEITPLHLSVQKGNEEISEMLLNKGANINAKQKDRKTALHIAIQENNENIVKILLKFGTDIDSINSYGETALHIASELGYIKIVKILLEHCPDINIRNIRDYTPLDCALIKNISLRNSKSDDDDYDDYDDYNDYCDRVIDLYDEIIRILDRHMIKLKTANLYVSNKLHYNLPFNYETRIFQNKCEKEIESMKSEKIYDDVLFYDILTKNIKQLAMYSKNENIVQILRSDDYKIKFPIYASIINNNFKKGEKRKELLEKNDNKIFLFFFDNFGLPPECTEKIFNYLSNKDLKILMDTCL